MSTKKTVLVVRFYGRFVFVRPKAPSTDLIALAIKMNKNPHVTAGKHVTFLTIPSRNVDVESLALEEQYKPIHRTVGTDFAPFQGASDVWNIEGRDININEPGGFAWSSLAKIPIADLNQLTKQRLNAEYIKSIQPESPVNAIIRLHAGAGETFHLAKRDLHYDYVSVDATQHLEYGDRLADGIQVRITLPRDQVDLVCDTPAAAKANSIRIGRSNTLSPFEGASVSSDKDLSSDDFDSVIVLSFSNLCTGREDVLIDKEFAGFYELLIDPPDPAKRLVPQVIGIGPEVPRFGDCFLNAKISE